MSSFRRALVALLLVVLVAPAAEAAKATPAPKPPPCPNRAEYFTKHLIDPASVTGVAPVGGQTGSGGVLAVRSYVFPNQALRGKRLPIYAPAAMTLVGASYYLPMGAPAGYKPEYSLYFSTPCNLEVKLFHIKEVHGAVAGAVPKKASSSSASQGVKATAVKAGDQIGWYTPAEGSVAFDFWVDDLTVTNSFLSPKRYAQSNALHAVCPWQFYAKALRSVWYAKLGNQGGTAVPGTSCGTVTQGAKGSVLGQWFRDPDVNNPVVDRLTYDGTYLSQAMVTLESTSDVRLGGFYAPGAVFVSKQGPAGATWSDPRTMKVGELRCFADGARAVSLQLTNATTLRAAVTADCATPVPSTEWRTYYR
ncbi:MAG: hypothetical protein JWO68_1482 [Actinomycetia bacterium]|nr:hypothetical protein [Actinomycetes bacterium]